MARTLARPEPTVQAPERAAIGTMLPPERLSWEVLAYGVVALAAIASRFWDLGARALHHDESLHAVYSWYLYTGRGYTHDPLMHGPFQFHAGALGYFLFGDSDATARFPAAFFGVLMVLAPWLLRPVIGRAGALATSVIFLISPVFLYYGRFDREDIYVAVFTLGMAISAWRYVLSQERRWLYAFVAFLAFAFCTKETTFITVAVFGSFFTFRWIAVMLERRGGLPLRQVVRGVELDLLVPLGAFTLPQLTPFVDELLFARLGIQPVRMFDLPAPVGLVRGDDIASVVVVLLAIGGSCVVGHLWNRQVFWRAAGLFALIYVPLYTTFFTNPGGLGTGIWGSLDYWLEQQAVQRGNQPGYYYIILLPIYEFLPLAVAGAAAVVAGVRRSRQWFLAALAGLPAFYLLSLLPEEREILMKIGSVALIFGLCLAVMIVPRIRGWNLFLLYWSVAALAAYSIAGEKMPWLSLHIATPILLGAGTGLGHLATSIDWRSWWARRGWAYAVALPLLGFVLFQVVRGRVDQAQTPAASLVAALGVLLIIVAGLIWLVSRFGWRFVGITVVTGLLAIGAALTVRTALVASFRNGDVPVEMLVYTQTTPDIPRLAAELAVLEATRPAGQPPRISVDSDEGYTWPWAWYLRNAPAAQYPLMKALPARPEADVIIIHAINDPAMQAWAAEYSEPTRFRHRWWFPEDYRGLTLGQFLTNLTRPESYRIWWDYFFHRRTVSPLGTTDAVVYFPRDFRPPVLP